MTSRQFPEIDISVDHAVGSVEYTDDDAFAWFLDRQEELAYASEHSDAYEFDYLLEDDYDCPSIDLSVESFNSL